jgi:phosphatidate phosphatase APP1
MEAMGDSGEMPGTHSETPSETRSEMRARLKRPPLERPPLSRRLLWALHRAESVFDGWMYRLRRRLGRLRPCRIVTYRGFGNREQVHLSGRVLEDNGFAPPRADASVWRNVLASLRRFTAPDVRGARIRLELGDASNGGVCRECPTDEEGYFTFHVQPPDGLPTDRIWHEARVVLVDRPDRPGETAAATAEFTLPRPDSQFGVISDIDDTVMQSHATDVWRLAWLTFTRNAHTRSPFEGVSAFYQALEQGAGRDRKNPFFYVSSSAWNIYDLLTDFLEIHGLPKGPILLRDLGVDRDKFIKTGHDHKLEKIERILASCPELPFILIGDSGQRDPHIYRRVVHDFPGRVLAVYIRDVAEKRREGVLKIREELRAAGVEMELVKDTERAALHAAEHGWIAERKISKVRQDIAREQDSQEPDVVKAEQREAT